MYWWRGLVTLVVVIGGWCPYTCNAQQGVQSTGLPHLFYSEKSAVTELVRTDADLVFRTNFTGQTRYQFTSIIVRVDKEVVAIGGTTFLTTQLSKVFGRRLAGTDPLGERYRLSLRMLTYEDSVVFAGSVIFGDSTKPPTQFFTTETRISLTVTGGPDMCDGDIPGTTHINTTGLSRVEVIMCGNPKPTIQWRNGSITLSGASELISGFKARYRYYLQMTTVMPSMCGDEITFVATGLDGVRKEGSTKLNVNFEPSSAIGWSYRLNSSCIRVMWQLIDIGTCSGLIYHVEYLNASHSPLSGSNTSHPASHHDYCPDHVNAINSTRIRASYNGNMGSWSSINTVLPTDPFVNPDPGTGRSTGNNDDDEWKVILGGVLGGFFFLLLIILLLIYCCCFWVFAAFCACCACSDCCEKEEDKESGVSTTNSLGFQYKKNSKKKPKSVKSVKVVLDKDTHDGRNTYVSTVPSIVVPLEREPAVIYAHPDKKEKHRLGEMKYFDPNEFDIAPEAPETLQSNYTNSTYDYGDDIDNKPSFLI